MTAGQVYRTLLRLYPDDYWDGFAGEMVGAFDQAAEERRGQGLLEYAHFLLEEFGGLIRGAAADRLAKLTTQRTARWRVLPDLRLMRPPEITREEWFRWPEPKAFSERTPGSL